MQKVFDKYPSECLIVQKSNNHSKDKRLDVYGGFSWKTLAKYLIIILQVHPCYYGYHFFELQGHHCWY